MSPFDSTAWRAFHKIGQQLLPHLSRQISNHSGITSAEYSVLLSLHEAGEATLTVNELATSLGWEISRMSHQVTRMHQNGLLKKVKNEVDCRCFDVSLTSEGRRVIARAIPLQSVEINHCFSTILTKTQMQTLIEISEVISEHLATHHSSNAK